MQWHAPPPATHCRVALPRPPPSCPTLPTHPPYLQALPAGPPHARGVVLAAAGYEAAVGCGMFGGATIFIASRTIFARVGGFAAAALHQALDIAGESKGIIAGTVAALALWFLRHPLIAWAEHMLGDQAEESETDD